MSITRTRLQFESHYTQIPNAWMRDKRLSRRARGLLAELMTHQVGWKVTAETLADGGPEGRDAIRNCIKELESAGYLRRERQRDENNRLGGVDYILSEPNDLAAPPMTDYQSLEIDPKTEKPVTGNPVTGNQQVRTPSTEDDLKKGGDDTVKSPAPEIERDRPWDDLQGGGRAERSGPASRPDRCDFHQHANNPPPCTACKDARTNHENHLRQLNLERAQEDRRREQEAYMERRQRISDCFLCDDDGYLNGRPCHHDPDQPERNRRGAELVKKSLLEK